MHYKLVTRNGKTFTERCSLEEFADWMSQDMDRHVGLTEKGDVTVSTVFLGLDHSLGAGRPLLFETMVFGGSDDQWQERYQTYEQAIAGHHAACERFLPKGN